MLSADEDEEGGSHVAPGEGEAQAQGVEVGVIVREDMLLAVMALH